MSDGSPFQTSRSLSEVIATARAAGAGLGDEAFARLLDGVDPAHPVSGDDLRQVRALLSDLAARTGVGRAHRVASTLVLAACDGWELTHDRGHPDRLLTFAVSPDGRYLAVGSPPGDDWDRGGTLQVWETASGRCVNTLVGVPGGISFVGDEGERARMRWHPSGDRVGSVFNTNAVGIFDPYGDWPDPTTALYLTDGWDHGPAWCWSPDGR